MVRMANGSACRLVDLVLRYIPGCNTSEDGAGDEDDRELIYCLGFRDTEVYRGRLIHFYKRAQIVVSDVWAAYGQQTDPSKSRFAFRDMDQLTMFADYRVPQILRAVDVLRYDEHLSARVDALQEIPFGSEEEVEIRACTVEAVERLRVILMEKHGIKKFSVELDWWLWQQGEEKKDAIKPHHRTRTIYY